MFVRGGERRGPEIFEVFNQFWWAPYGGIRSRRAISAAGPRASARRSLARCTVARRWTSIVGRTHEIEDTIEHLAVGRQLVR